MKLNLEIGFQVWANLELSNFMFGVDLSKKLRQASKPPKNAFDKLT